MNERGNSWPETLLVITVVWLIFGSLVPFFVQMRMSLYEKKMSMYAAETAYHASIEIIDYQKQFGSRTVEGVLFEWQWEGDGICVYYVGLKGREERCYKPS